jgi:putative transposase
MVQDAVRRRNVSVRFACQLFVVSESCYRYQPKLNEENDVIAGEPGFLLLRPKNAAATE